jgi:hypothetical protein
MIRACRASVVQSSGIAAGEKKTMHAYLINKKQQHY